jgi:serine/threonine protein kinase
MELGDYGSLWDVVTTRDSIGKFVSFPPVVILTWIYQIADALAFLHNLKILHKDIKAENILVMRELNAKLADFGTAKQTDGSRTTSGEIVGTFLAPEVRNHSGSTFKSDVYALGATLVQCCLKEIIKTFDINNVNRAIEVLPVGLKLNVKIMLMEMKEENPDHRPTAQEVT